MTIEVGDTVTWTWGGSNQHSTTSDDGQSDSWDSGARRTGTFAHTFEIAGTFTYHCVIHSSMHGTVIVQGAGGATQYRNCRAMHRDWEHGVAQSGPPLVPRSETGSVAPTSAERSTEPTERLDVNDDGVACEA